MARVPDLPSNSQERSIRSYWNVPRPGVHNPRSPQQLAPWASAQSGMPASLMTALARDNSLRGDGAGTRCALTPCQPHTYFSTIPCGLGSGRLLTVAGMILEATDSANKEHVVHAIALVKVCSVPLPDSSFNLIRISLNRC
jgi:hypothetical protein